MGERQLLLVLLTLGLLGATTLSISNFLMLTNEEALQDDIRHEATMIAQRIIEEAKAKKFDSNISKGPFPENLTDPFELMAEENETMATFDDIDDFGKGFSENEVQPLEFEVVTEKGRFAIATVVTYVRENNLEQDVWQKQLYKKLTVTVKSSKLNHDIVLSHVFGLISPA